MNTSNSSASMGTTSSRYDNLPGPRFLHPFVSLFRLPRAFWVINIAYALDGFAYFGVLALLVPFLTRIGVPDAWATFMTGTFAMAVTLFMFGFGSYSERFGVRRAMLAALVIVTMGRVILCASGGTMPLSTAVLTSMAALLFMAIGEGVLQTANYSGLKQYSDKRTNAMAFGFNYALFNLGIAVIGLLSPEIRVGVDNILKARRSGQPGPANSLVLSKLADWTGDGMVAVFLICTLATVVAIVFSVIVLTRRAEADKLRPEDEQRIAAQRDAESSHGHFDAFVKSVITPFFDVRFAFFVFILFPARTLFAHQIHTIGLYILRAYPEGIANKMEYFQNLVNPVVVCTTVPILAALTRKMDMVRLMLLGTLVTAMPTFLLCIGERGDLLLTYMIVFSLGEALWQPRFYQFAADLAPEGKMGAYMAAANIPWLLAKWTTGWYAGLMLSIFCPADGPRNPGIMWAVYGAIALISPIGLWLARDWLRAGLHAKPADN